MFCCCLVLFWVLGGPGFREKTSPVSSLVPYMCVCVGGASTQCSLCAVDPAMSDYGNLCNKNQSHLKGAWVTQRWERLSEQLQPDWRLEGYEIPAMYRPVRGESQRRMHGKVKALTIWVRLGWQKMVPKQPRRVAVKKLQRYSHRGCRHSCAQWGYCGKNFIT